MRFDAPAPQNPIDRRFVVGKPLDRIDGRFKTAGTAAHACKWHGNAPTAAHGHIVAAAIAKGRIRAIDLAGAEAAPGVLAVVTADNAGKLGKGDRNTAPPLGGPEVAHYHQTIGVVVAETFEQARAAAHLVRVDYDPQEGAFDLAAARNSARQTTLQGDPGDSAVGDFAAAFTARARLDETYANPDQAHTMLEPHASMAAGDDDRLTLWTSTR